MKSNYFGDSMKLTWALVSAIFAVAIVWTVSQVMAAPANAAQTDRLVSIYDRGEERAIITKATSVAAALQDAKITVDPADIVEPAMKEKLVAKNYHINVYRARPVVVKDGNTRVRVMTAEQSPRQIAAAAKLTLYDEDNTKVERVDDVVGEGGAGLKLLIDRATPFTFVLYGKTFLAHSQQTTVGDMLHEKNVKLGPKDGTSLPLATPLVAGMTVEVWRNGVQTVTQEEDVAMPIRQVKNADQPIGFKQVQTPGKPGKKQVTYELNLQNGKEVSRKIIQSVVSAQPIEQVEIIGAKAELGRNYSAEKIGIMAAAGISESEYGAAGYIIDHENGMWCPTRWQGQSSCPAVYQEKFPGAESSSQVGYGLCQSTPADKMAVSGSDWRTNPVTQMKWCTSYAVKRYGSWTAAYQHWLSAHSW